MFAEGEFQVPGFKLSDILDDKNKVAEYLNTLIFLCWDVSKP